MNSILPIFSPQKKSPFLLFFQGLTAVFVLLVKIEFFLNVAQFRPQIEDVNLTRYRLRLTFHNSKPASAAGISYH
jgi:hypothetical protein